ncbi:MAG: hypothetical protein LBQ67_07905 [Treponema sp.]|nr:hypothetical protein [Treponema sp.]
MKKVLLLLAVLVIAGGAAFGFDILSYPPPVGGGDILVDIGIGFTRAAYGDLVLPPLRLSAEYALPVGVPISVGGLFAFHRSEYKLSLIGSQKWTWNHITFGGRGNWHWGLDVSWLDLYTGIFLGYEIASLTYDGPNKSYYEDYYDVGGFTAGGQVGAHFYFTDMLGAMVEFGYPYWFNVGLALKF